MARMRRFGRGQVRLRDERPANWSEEDEARHRNARERWQLWVVFWMTGSVAAFLGGEIITLGSPLVLWLVAALLAVPFGIWTGPTLPDLVRRNEDERRNNRIRVGVTLLLCLVGTLAWFGALVWFNAVFDTKPRRMAAFQVVSVARGQGRAPFSRVVISSNGRQFILSGQGARVAQLKEGQQLQLPMGRGLFRVSWLDGNQ